MKSFILFLLKCLRTLVRGFVIGSLFAVSGALSLILFGVIIQYCY